MKIEEIDANFAAKSVSDADDVVWYDLRKPPFDIYGLYDVQNTAGFTRFPKYVGDGCNDGVKELRWHTAGGRARFKTDSPYIAIKVFWFGMTKMSHMAFTGSSGFDLICRCDGKTTYVGALHPQINGYDEGFDWKCDTVGKLADYELSFPLYNTVKTVYVGIKRGCTLLEGEKYKIQKPFVYYGSSITQGGCASKPSGSYQSLISKRFDADFINLGFSGSALGEEAMARYIAGLDMSVFILDYDHNAPSSEHLAATHLPFYKTVREKQPDTPMVIVSRPTPIIEKNREIVKATYDYAVAAGDKNVVFVDGDTLFEGDYKYLCTVDNCHPTDLGFYRMAKVIGDAIEKVFKG